MKVEQDKFEYLIFYFRNYFEYLDILKIDTNLYNQFSQQKLKDWDLDLATDEKFSVWYLCKSVIICQRWCRIKTDVDNSLKAFSDDVISGSEI